jgi:HPt (histidine-containing phosphotransfer) domain-containing protein
MRKNKTISMDPKPYNLYDLKKMSNNDETFIKQTLGIFIENSEDAVKEFRKSLREQNWKKIGEVAHKILPSCRHLEADSVVPKLMEIKSKTLIEMDNEGVTQQVNETITQLNHIISAMKEEIGDSGDL